MPINANSPLTFKYLNLPNGLGGRGGVQRFFLLSQNIPFEEKLVDFAEWELEKERLVTSNENPCATLPIIYTNNNQGKQAQLIQHIAASRYLARVHDVTSGCDYKDYVQDLVADEYQGFRDAWVKVAFTGTDDDKKTYKDTEVPKYLAKFEGLYGKYKTHETYLSVSKSTGHPLWGDAALFGLLRDHVLTELVCLDALKASYPNLYGLYESYGSIAAVKAWTDKKAAEKK